MWIVTTRVRHPASRHQRVHARLDALCALCRTSSIGPVSVAVERAGLLSRQRKLTAGSNPAWSSNFANYYSSVPQSGSRRLGRAHQGVYARLRGLRETQRFDRFCDVGSRKYSTQPTTDRRLYPNWQRECVESAFSGRSTRPRRTILLRAAALRSVRRPSKLQRRRAHHPASRCRASQDFQMPFVASAKKGNSRSVTHLVRRPDCLSGERDSISLRSASRV